MATSHPHGMWIGWLYEEIKENTDMYVYEDNIIAALFVHQDLEANTALFNKTIDRNNNGSRASTFWSELSTSKNTIPTRNRKVETQD